MRSLWFGVLVCAAMLVACGGDDSDFATRLREGSFTDSRDGQTYKTVTIGKQTWMAEKLNYAYTDVPYSYIFDDSLYTSDSTSWCYDNDPANCAKYGRLYDWYGALKACPEGWHLPDSTEWNTLFAAVGGLSTAGEMLKSTGGWDRSDNGVSGADAYSFSVLPAGFWYFKGEFKNEGSVATFWFSMEYNSDYAYFVLLTYDIVCAVLGNSNKFNGNSVRCVKD